MYMLYHYIEWFCCVITLSGSGGYMCYVITLSGSVVSLDWVVLGDTCCVITLSGSAGYKLKSISRISVDKKWTLIRLWDNEWDT